MSYQMYGTLCSNKIHAEVFLSIDKDLPNEFLFTIIPKGLEAFAILAVTDDSTESIFTLKPRNLFKPQNNGGLFLPKLSPKEIYSLQNSEIALKRNASGGFNGTWKTPNDSGSIDLESLLPESTLKAETLNSWQDFKNWVSKSQESSELAIFRGHGSKEFPLCTSLHRIGRNRLERYCNETLSKFHGEVEAELGIKLNLSEPSDYSVILGLAQHHGLPTPMLDWTESPYIAAFFAFSDALDSSHRKESTHVRIFALTKEFVGSTSPANVVLTWPKPFVASLAISARHNARLRAQQGRFLVTNVANLESWLSLEETRTTMKYLHAVDIPISCASEALQDLAYMGLTAATMFPGLDGVCRALRHQMDFNRLSQAL